MKLSFLEASWLAELAGPALLLALCIFFYGRLLLGDIPVNHDHPVFLFRAWHTAWLLGHQGSALGYSPFMFVGLPANGLYPLGVDFLVIGVKLLGLWLISWETAYAWALFIFILLGTGSLYALGRAAGGRVCGTLAGALWLLDRGAWFQGGWSFSLDWGVWSMGLSAALSTWAVYFFWKMIYQPGRRWFLLGAAAVGGAVLSHPMAVAILGLALPLLVICEGLRESPGGFSGWLPRATGAGLLGLGLCAFWLVPFVARREWFEPLGYHWTDYPEMVRRFWEGKLFEDTAPLVLMGGALGLLWAAGRRIPFGFFFLITSGIFLYIASDSFFLDVGALEKFPSLANLQTERFAYFIRVGLLLGLSLALTLPWRDKEEVAGARPCLRLATRRFRAEALKLWAASPTRAAPSENSALNFEVKNSTSNENSAKKQISQDKAWMRYLKVALVGAALGPLLVYLPRVGELPYLTPKEPLQWASKSESYANLKQAAAFINRMDRRQIGRVAVKAYRHDHLMAMFPVLTGLPIFKSGFTPQNNTLYKVESEDPAVWRETGVTHALTEGPMNRPDFTELGRFGRLFLYRIENADPASARLEGPGELSVLEDRPERLVVELRGTSAESRLTIRRARYALWRARINGEPVEILPHNLSDQPLMMEIAAREGRLELEYRAGFFEWAGGIISLLALLLFVALGLSGLGKAKPYYEKLLHFLAAKSRLITLIILLAAGLMVFAVLVKLLLPAPSHLEGRKVVTDFTKILEGGRAEIVTAGRATPCPFQGERHACPNHPWIFAGPVVLSADNLIRRCVWLHPVDASEFFLHFDEVELADRLEGYYGMSDEVNYNSDLGPVEFTVYLDGQPAGKFTSPPRRGWSHWEVDTSARRGERARVSFSSKAAFCGKRAFCFTAYITRME